MSPTDVTLRPALADDAAELAALLVATRRAAEPAMPPMIATESQAVEFLGRRIASGEVWVADGVELLAFAIITDSWLHSLYVGPQHQGSGLGSALLDLTKAMRPEGFGLWVFASNGGARGFYRRHGLLELEHTDGSANQEKEPDVRMVWPGAHPLRFLRHEIDVVDDDMAQLLARRFALTAAVQGHKDTPGHEGRDPEREREIAVRMSRHSPGLDPDRVARVMDTVISESLEQWAQGE